MGNGRFLLTEEELSEMKRAISNHNVFETMEKIMTKRIDTIREQDYRFIKKQLAIAQNLMVFGKDKVDLKHWTLANLNHKINKKQRKTIEHINRLCIDMLNRVLLS